MRVVTKMEERGARGRVARLTIAREEKLNALDPDAEALWDERTDGIDDQPPAT